MQQSTENRIVEPSRWRFTVAMIFGVYPIVTALLYGLEPLTRGWMIWQRTLLIAPLMVTLIVWGLIPAVHRYLGRFLVRVIAQ